MLLRMLDEQSGVARLEGARVIDVGCGFGTSTLEAAERVAPSGRVVGVDISAAMLQPAWQRVAAAGVDNVELLRATADDPEPDWILDGLAERGITCLLLEGGPTVNAAFLAAGALDEVFWTVGASLIGSDGLPMIAPISGGSPWADHPRRGSLVSVHRNGDELFLRYRFG